MDNSAFMSEETTPQSPVSIELLDFPKQRGSMCEVCRVRRFGKHLLLKRLLPRHANSSQYRLAFRKEFETGYLLEHPNLVRYMEWDENEDGSFMLLEYVDGWTLGEFLKENVGYFNQSDNERLFVEQMLSVLSYLHSHQVIHLDIKPDNILISRIGKKVKLIDLGCSYSDTFAGTEGLTRDFAAPEQLTATADHQVVPQSDLYALGKILMWIETQSGCHLSRSAHRLAQGLLREKIEERPHSAEEALLLYQRKRGLGKALSLMIVVLAVVSIAILYVRNKETPKVTTDEEFRQHVIIEDKDTATVAIDNTTKEPTTNVATAPNKSAIDKSPTITQHTEEAFPKIEVSSISSDIFSLENARKYIAENVDDGRQETQLFIHEVDSVLEAFYSHLSSQYNPLTLDNYKNFIAERTNFGFEFRHFVDEASARYCIPSGETKEISESLYNARNQAEEDRLFVFLWNEQLLRE